VAHQEGFYTAFGDCTPLVGATDDALAIFGPGEEVDMSFASPQGSPIPGWTRHYVLELNGWCKDRDLYTQDGELLEPLPHRAPDTVAREQLHQRFNTRYQAGE
jgi:hypothetical protein